MVGRLHEPVRLLRVRPPLHSQAVDRLPDLQLLKEFLNSEYKVLGLKMSICFYFIFLYCVVHKSFSFEILNKTFLLPANLSYFLYEFHFFKTLIPEH